MRRIYEDAAYGPQGACFWADTVPPETWPVLDKDQRCDVAVIGGGFTGLNAALTLAEAGCDVAVLEAQHPGWGASGRNGGFCCLGGSKLNHRQMTARFGKTATQDWHAAEKAAVDHVSRVIQRFGLDVDRHSQGETQLAHSARAWQRMQGDATEADSDAVQLIPKADLAEHGLNGPWYGASTSRHGFALNPRKYHRGLSDAAQNAGARLFQNTPVTSLVHNGTWRITTPKGVMSADQVILATNGYSSEDLPDWLRARYLPVMSNIIVTRPLTPDEQAAQGWTSAQMAYDSRLLLHYFRLMPCGRFLFGMRGGLRATPRAQLAISSRIRADFKRLFPAWSKVPITHEWSGLACVMRALTPFIGAVPHQPGLLAGLGFHGNGVAMGSYAGTILADLAIRGRTGQICPDFLAEPPRRFPLGRARRVLLSPAYWAAERFDL